MIISRKKFEEAISKAVAEEQEKIFVQRQLDEKFRYVNDDINSLRQRIFRIEDELEFSLKVDGRTVTHKGE